MFLINLTYKGAAVELSRDARGRFAAVRPAQKAAFETIGKTWHGEMLPVHFTRKGARQYGYTRRSGEQHPYGSKAFWRSYTGRKKRKFGHTDPLVWSGASRMLSKTGRLVATSKRVTVTVPAPALNYRNPHSQIDMRREVTAMIAAELQRLGEVGGRRMADELNKARDEVREVV